jgi:hypothetical protein
MDQWFEMYHFTQCVNSEPSLAGCLGLNQIVSYPSEIKRLKATLANVLGCKVEIGAQNRKKVL